MSRLVLAAATGLLLAGCGGGGGDGGSDGGGGGGPVIIDIVEVAGSGESGTAELTPNGQVTDVLISTGGLAAGVPNPVGIYKGTCTNVQGEAAYKLPDLQEGLSATTLDVPLSELLGGYVVNVQKSASDDTSIACGEIKRPAE